LYVAATYKGVQSPRLTGLAGTVLSAPLAAPGPALRRLDEGDALRDQRDFDRAAEKYDRAVEARRDLADAYLRRAEARYRLERFDDMLADCDEALRLDPGNAAAYDLRGDAHRGKAGKLQGMNADEMSLALQDYDAAVAADPDFAPFYNSRGTARGSIAVAAERRGDPAVERAEDEQAVEDFGRAIDLAPKPRSLYFENRARAFKRLGKYDRSADDYTAALQAGDKPGRVGLFRLHYNRGNVFLELKDFARAEADFGKAATLAPDDPDPHLRRARALDGLNRRDEAREERKKAAEMKRRTPAPSQ
jgi:tetratricopeptide (TPR) repeat protein